MVHTMWFLIIYIDNDDDTYVCTLTLNCDYFLLWLLLHGVSYHFNKKLLNKNLLWYCIFVISTLQKCDDAFCFCCQHAANTSFPPMTFIFYSIRNICLLSIATECMCYSEKIIPFNVDLDWWIVHTYNERKELRERKRHPHDFRQTCDSLFIYYQFTLFSPFSNAELRCYVDVFVCVCSFSISMWKVITRWKLYSFEII